MGILLGPPPQNPRKSATVPEGGVKPMITGKVKSIDTKYGRAWYVEEETEEMPVEPAPDPDSLQARYERLTGKKLF